MGLPGQVGLTVPHSKQTHNPHPDLFLVYVLRSIWEIVYAKKCIGMTS